MISLEFPFHWIVFGTNSNARNKVTVFFFPSFRPQKNMSRLCYRQRQEIGSDSTIPQIFLDNVTIFSGWYDREMNTCRFPHSTLFDSTVGTDCAYIFKLLSFFSFYRGDQILDLGNQLAVFINSRHKHHLSKQSHPQPIEFRLNNMYKSDSWKP